MLTTDRTQSSTLWDKAHAAAAEGRWQLAAGLLKRLTSTEDDQAEVQQLRARIEEGRNRREEAEKAFERAADLAPGDTAIYRDWARFHCRAGEWRKGEYALRIGIVRNPQDRGLLACLGELKREADERDDAASIYDHLNRHFPPEPQTLHARALVELERGGDARAYFARALDAAPTDRNVLTGAATALHQAGDSDGAINLLRQGVRMDPGWIEGLRGLARLRSERGDQEGFAADHLEAIARRPRDGRLWASFLGLFASALRFELVLKHLGEARSSVGDVPIFDMLEAQALSECGRTEEATRLFECIDPAADPTFVPVFMRFLLRTGQIGRAAETGEAFVQGVSAAHVWPLLALAWRKAGDPRWQWLDQHEDMVGQFELPLDEGEIAELAHLLRRLHRRAGQPYDQSARNGTQTMGSLLLRTHPPITRLRAALREAVARYIERLPPIDRRHPFLGRPRGDFRLAGSWSIRLQDMGHHIPHVHPEGWISSACHIALPSAGRDGRGTREGWLELGASPPELGLDLPPVRSLEPRQGGLVLFPSNMWHGTVPFTAGERLTVAFDVVPGAA